jgi:hypothetical protein
LLPSRALYWMNTLYFFDKPELSEAITLAKSSPSRLVRDAAELFEELKNGRTHVGQLDFAETRKRFQALDLDPARAEQRAKSAGLVGGEERGRARRGDVAATGRSGVPAGAGGGAGEERRGHGAGAPPGRGGDRTKGVGARA